MPWRRRSSAGAGGAAPDATHPSTTAAGAPTQPRFKRYSGTFQAAIADLQEDYGHMFGKQDLVDKARARRASIDSLVDRSGNPVRIGQQHGGTAAGAARGTGPTATAATAGTVAGATHPPMAEQHPSMATSQEAAAMNAPSMQGPDTQLHPDTGSHGAADNLGPLRDDSVDAVGRNRTSARGDEQYYTPPGSTRSSKLWGRLRHK
ncbi:hypothetical protein SYNPS1DRAFT_29108 [Syncephalis pseudoplumigaleata]|uniref:Uncharacterized protein n=1 Tax=Syncephalis pseudoplumigaleata TaxID=1712513 RepID=A0A4V1J1I2_9FUNG|nr:hypothetical protein SYNPS1DRAFT_29108 [Syncephalis pseudoplumigaleata]|eukprot:RKP25149.1 hypothetical protein SYNPS1DRAFT_29108 [Syncephalis pseudoplumigaleata]